MKILFIANRVPYPPYRGDKLKIYNLAKQLHTQHTLHLLTIAENKEELGYKTDLSKFFEQIEICYLPPIFSKINVIKASLGSTPFQVAYFKSKAFERILANTNLSQYDAIHVQHLRMSAYVLPYMSPKIILDLPDAFSLYWQRRAEKSKNPFQKWFNTTEAKRLRGYEVKILPNFATNLVCNIEDRDYLAQLTGANVNMLQNGVDTDSFKPDFETRVPNRILFTGNMDYAPNVDGVLYFVQEIFPIIEQAIPNVEFIIAGQRPVDKVKALAKHNIKVTGFVQDLAAEYNKASVVVAPLRFGAGTQNKVLEAMACAVPVVCTHIGFAGLQVQNGDGIWSCTEAMDFANKVIELLTNKELNLSAGKKGSAHVNRLFSWQGISQQLVNYFNQ